MPTSQYHIIRHHFLHVEVYGAESVGMALQRSLPGYCQNELMPALDRMLERIPEHEHWVIDRLEIDAGMLSLERLERELIEVVTRDVERQLREQAASAGLSGVFTRKQLPNDRAEENTAKHSRKDAKIDPVDGTTQTVATQLRKNELLPAAPIDLPGLMLRRTEAQSVHEAFLGFLKSGSLPWWFHLPAGNTLEQVVQASWQTLKASGAGVEHFRHSMADTIRFASVQKRLVQQFSADFLLTLLVLLAPENARVLREILIELEKTDFASEPFRQFCVALWQTALAEASAGKCRTASALVAECWNKVQDRQFPADYVETLLATIAPESAQILHGLIAELGSGEFESGPFSQFSSLLRKTAFVEALAGKRPTAIALVTECWNSLPEAERRHPMLLATVKRHWPQALQVKPPGNPQAVVGPHSTVLAASAGAPADVATRQSEKSSKPLENLDMREGTYVNCAGLVLLHPFLPRLFEALGIADKDKLLQPRRALCLLHYLATGQSIAPEYELLLPKLLCDLPFEHPVEADVNLTTAELEEATALLDAAVRHWDALGNTSADGLRGAFLVRPGKLSSKSDGDWLLQVETNSFDILLDRIPWGFGMVKLPWMERILWVEWR